MADPKAQAKVTLEKAVRAINNTLEDVSDARDKFKVRLRLYHGWHRGPAPTKNREALLALENDPNFELARFSRVSFEPQFEYGERLLAALPHRLTNSSHARFPRIHLPDTFRRPIKDGENWREKMVDTALACDILVHARQDPADWRVVLAEDDDLVPALFSAEAWSKERGGRTLLIRNRGESRYLVLDGLVREYRA